MSYGPDFNMAATAAADAFSAATQDVPALSLGCPDCAARAREGGAGEPAPFRMPGDFAPEADRGDYAPGSEGYGGAGGGSIGGKAVWSLDGIYDNFFREGGWDDNAIPTTYSFPTSRPSGYSAVTGEGADFSSFGLADRAAAVYAMGLLDEIIAPDFTNLGSGDEGGIRFMYTEDDDGSAHAKGPWQRDAVSGDVWMHSNWSNDAGQTHQGTFLSGWLGSGSLATLIHEIGHVAGLKHPGDYDASDDEAPTYDDDAVIHQDSNQYTIMSYFGAWETSGGANTGAEDGFLLHDIYALQRRYGAEMTTRTGDTTYGYGSNAGWIYDIEQNTSPRYAIWDAGGYDTIDFSGAVNPVRIDLMPGGFSSIGAFQNNIAIAYDVFADDPSDAWIERAYGGAGDDVVNGNGAANALYGGNGGDSMHGGDADDLLEGGDGDDGLNGGDDDDTLRGEDGEDSLFGGAGDDFLSGGDDDDVIYGDEGEDTLLGGAGDDVLHGGVGLDAFYGLSGLDRVDFRYSSGDWVINLQAGTATFGAGVETLSDIEGVWTGGGDDTVTLTAEDGFASTGGGDDTIYWRGGSDSINGGTGHDHLSFAGAAFGVAVDLGVPGPQKVIDRPDDALDRTVSLQSIERLTGASHGDTLRGSSFRDNHLSGGSGDDLLDGRGGVNLLEGGSGDDTLIAGTGNDTMIGGAGGVDVVSFERAAVGVDVSTADGYAVIAGIGANWWTQMEGLRGSAHADTLRGGSGANRIEGGGGDDIIFAMTGADTVLGGAGADLIHADPNVGVSADIAYGGFGDDTIHGAGGDDLLHGDQNDDSLFGGSGDDTLHGGSGADSLDGGSGSNRLYGDSGSDTLRAGTGADILDGGSGFDFADYRGLASFVAANLNQLFQNPQGAGADQLVSIEGAFGSDHGDILFGRAAASSVLYGEGGSDELQGGLDDDSLFGGLGNDTLRDAAGDDLLDGGAGRDRAIYAGAAGALTVDLSSATAQDTGGAGFDTLLSIEDFIAGDFDDFVYGSASANELHGGDGDDYLFGAGGLDQLHGGEGDDTLDGGAGDDAIFGGLGDDTAAYASASAGVVVSLAAAGAQWTFGAGWDLLDSVENLTGSNHADALTGTDGANLIRDLLGSDTVFAGGGADTILAGIGGNDRYEGGAGWDTISFAEHALAVNVDLQAGTSAGFSAGFDTLDSFAHATGGAGADTLRGSGAANTLRGGEGDDLLDGRGGPDLLVGGAGDDMMIGGAGADIFSFRLGDGADEIVGFAIGVDRIRFETGPDSFADLALFGSTIGYGARSSIMLASVDVALLSESDFIFA